MYYYLIVGILSGLLAFIAVCMLLVHIFKNQAVRATFSQRTVYIPIILLILSAIGGVAYRETYPPDFAMPMFMHAYAPGGLPPDLPFANIARFFLHERKFARIPDISANPSAVPTQPKQPDADGIVRLHLTVHEVISEIAPGIYQNYWTYGDEVPGPMMRIKEGDTVEFTLSNDKTSLHTHSIDLHAVTGPGGGSFVLTVPPGQSKTLRFKALAPGLFVYHCASPNLTVHNSHGQYGLILVDPKDPKLAFSKVDKEFYLMQGEFYTVGNLGRKGLMEFDANALLAGKPNYVVFNGRVDQDGAPRMHAKVGDRVRVYVGNGGVNLISSFHLIGSMFDTVYPEAAVGENSPLLHNVQTTAVLPGGASIVEFTLRVPGKYIFVDHALARMNKGAWAVLEVSGKARPDIYAPVNKGSTTAVPPTSAHSGTH